MDNVINWEIFSYSSQQLIRYLYDIIFSWWTFMIVSFFLSIKLLFNNGFTHIISYINNKFSFHKKTISLLEPIQENIKNIFYGLFGMLFTWTIVKLFFTVLWDFLKGLETSKEIMTISLLESQIKFASLINDFLRYVGVIEVILIFIAFMMLFFSFFWSIFKVAAKILWACAIILAGWAVIIGHYASMVSEIANRS